MDLYRDFVMVQGRVVARLWLALLVVASGLGSGALALAQPANTPEAVAAAFLDAWGSRDYATMYSYLSPPSQQEFPQPIFEARYQQTSAIIGLTGVGYVINSTHMQGLSAAINYDIVIQSSIFSSIDDPGRTMRLVRVNDRWGVAWSSMDIFAALAGDSTLTTSGRPRRRANIYDRNGNVLAEEGGSVVYFISNKNAMTGGVENCLDLLARTMRESRRVLAALFANYLPETDFFIGEMDIDTYTANRQELSSICGLGNAPTRQTRRYYGRNALTHVVGYIGQIPSERLDEFSARGYGAGDLIGLYGVERQYEETLAGQPERVLRIVEPGGTTLREFASAAGTTPTPVTLTLDRRLQLITVQALTDAYNYAANSWSRADISTGAAAVILDVNSGAIRALASYPLVNPAIFNPDLDLISSTRALAIQQVVADSRRPLNNRVTQEQYFPGSVYKLITAAAVLNEGLVDPDDIFECELEWDGTGVGDTLPSRTDWRATDGLPAAGPLTPAEAIMASCNPFFWQYGAELFREVGPNALVDYSQRMGMGTLYTVNTILPGAQGNLANPTNATAAINNAIGQGDLAIPPIQMAVAVTAIANGGTVYQPYLVQQVGGVDGTETSFTAQPQIMNILDFEPGVLETIQEGMCGVPVNRNLGTAEWVFRGISYTLCGKTGTAQAGGYPVAWFVAYAPRVNPEIAIVVMVERSREGSEIAAPIVRRILDDYFNTTRAPFPDFWLEEYVPLNIPEGSTAG